MRIVDLSLKNVGPFDEARIEFLRDPDEAPAVTLITGENGTGKTIVLDAIRAFFGSHFATLERSITRPGGASEIELRHVTDLVRNGSVERLSTTTRRDLHGGDAWYPLTLLPMQMAGNAVPPPWVVEFWRSHASTDSYAIDSLAKINHRALYQGALQGDHRNARVTEWLCHFDYLRDSHDPQEKAVGQAVFDAARKIIDWSLLDGEFVAVQRSTLTPMVRQAGRVVALQNLSSGNAYLIQRMISLLGRMYSLHMLRGGDPAELCNASGLLLIDEAENHLHPIWQKRFIPGIRAVFPNVQIIATTHSPFILSSVEGARVYVCRYDHEGGRCTVSEETDAYASKPVDEVLASGAFDHTAPFGGRVTALLDRRKAAIIARNTTERERVERELVAINPTYFAFLEMDRELEALRRAG